MYCSLLIKFIFHFSSYPIILANRHLAELRSWVCFEATLLYFLHVLTFIAHRYESLQEYLEWLLEPLVLLMVVLVDLLVHLLELLEFLEPLEQFEHWVTGFVTQGTECRLLLILVWHRFHLWLFVHVRVSLPILIFMLKLKQLYLQVDCLFPKIHLLLLVALELDPKASWYALLAEWHTNYPVGKIRFVLTSFSNE